MPSNAGNRILARAIVDIDLPALNGHLGQYKVEVWGEEPHDYVRYYTVRAKSDNLAAQEGLRRFVEEIEALIAKGK
jgi:hypothetical protein